MSVDTSDPRVCYWTVLIAECPLPWCTNEVSDYSWVGCVCRWATSDVDRVVVRGLWWMTGLLLDFGVGCFDF